MNWLQRKLRARLDKADETIMWLQLLMLMILGAVCLTVIVQCIGPADAARLHREKWYQDRWCTPRGVMEVVLQDRTRVDCLTDEYAIEVDFAGKWAEAVGQSLHYARLTGKKPGVLLIIEQPKDEKYLTRLNGLADTICPKIKVWVARP